MPPAGFHLLMTGNRLAGFIEAGLKFFGTIGYARSTIRGICRAAGLTQRYFYESFQNKEDLLAAVYRKLIQDIEADARDILAEPGISPAEAEAAYNLLKRFYTRLKEDHIGDQHRKIHVF